MPLTSFSLSIIDIILASVVSVLYPTNSVDPYLSFNSYQILPTDSEPEPFHDFLASLLRFSVSSLNFSVSTLILSGFK